MKLAPFRSLMNFIRKFWRAARNWSERYVLPFIPKAWKKAIAFLKRFWHGHKNFRRTIGVLFIIIGSIAFFTPATPGSWLILVGLEIFGFRILFWEKIKGWLRGRMASFWRRK